jgi:hypothetical protein
MLRFGQKSAQYSQTVHVFLVHIECEKLNQRKKNLLPVLCELNEQRVGGRRPPARRGSK